tara:strand:- start:1323 stop:1706 length:384 start_codon:yes stop_codon:yes gene_type:complete
MDDTAATRNIAFHRTTLESALEILKHGLKSRASQQLEANCEAIAWGNRVEHTFVSIKGVQQNWARDGVQLAFDLDAIEASGLKVHADDFGAHDVGDRQVLGDIPASMVLGIVSDEWVKNAGYICLMD